MHPLFLDNHLLALDKPGGLLTQPSGTQEDSLEQQGKAFLKETFQKPGNVFLEAVHRIDRPACGIVLFARTSKALTRMNAVMREGRCAKTYRIIIHGSLPQHEGSLQDWLVHDDFHAEIARPGAAGARLCRLQYRILKALPGARSLVEVDLETGRYHQIRVQFAHRNCPIVGDGKYGAPETFRDGAIALQHYRLVTPHPTLPEPLAIQSGIDLLQRFA